MSEVQVIISALTATSILSCFITFSIWRINRDLIKAGKEYANKIQHYINEEARPRDLRYFSQWLDLKGWVQEGEYWTNKKMGKERFRTDEVIGRYIAEVGNIRFK